MRLSRAHFAPSGPEKRLASPHFSLSIRDAAPGGCAVVVSKKVAKFAVTRHLLKRRVLVVLRPWCAPTQALVVYARPGAQTLSFEELKLEVTSLVARALG